MVRRFGSLAVTLLCFGAWQTPAAAQEAHYKLGGGAGFAYFRDPELALARAADLGGFIGFRFSDNLSLEFDFSFARSKRFFTADNEPAEDALIQEAAFELQSTRYRLDAVVLYNLGRRQPFHPFVLAGAGMQREVLGKRENLTDPESRLEAFDIDLSPAVTFGTGFDFYVLYNVAARFEYRWWIPPAKMERATSRLFFQAAYFF